MADQQLPEEAVSKAVDEIVERVITGLGDVELLTRVGSTFENVVATLVKVLVTVILKVSHPVMLGIAKGQIGAEELSDPAFGELARLAIRDMFDVNIPAPRPGRAGESGLDPNAGRAIGRAILEGVTKVSPGTSGALQPGTAGAEAFLGTMGKFALEGWLQGWMSEVRFLGQVESMAQLDDTMAATFGFGRVSSRVLRAAIEPLVVTPMRWQINKTHRPELLSPSDAVRQVLRGKWTREQANEELARQGWSDDRIDAFFNAGAKSFSASDARVFVERAHWTRDRGLQELRDQGYTQDQAEDALRLAGLRRFDELEGAEASAIIGAYAARDIDRGDFLSALNAHVSVDTERHLLEELGELRRTLNIKHLTAGQAAACVKAGILAVPDYRAALRREGYTADAVLALELLIRHELDDASDIAQLRAQADADRLAEKQARAAAAAARKAEIDAERALRRRGPIAALERAVVRGLIPFARLEEVLLADYDADTVAILVDLVEQERQAYLAQQQRAADAAKRADRRGLDVGALNAAVLAYVLSIGDYRTRLGQLGFDQADVDVLADTLEARLADQAAAQAARDQAETRAKRRSIDLTRFEFLVRRGARTLGDYDALLASLEFDDASRAALVDVLRLKLAEDQAAQAARARVDAQLPAGGLTIDQFRRAVLLGVKTFAEFDAFLISQTLDADVHALIVAELRADVDQAAAARQRRTATASSGGHRELPLATVARAARLGIVTPAAYEPRLRAAGYADDDVAIELGLLRTEVADVTAARETRATIERELVSRGLSLAELARAVRAGVASLEAYQSRALTLGLDTADVTTLVRVLGDELRESNAARARRAEIASELDARQVSLPVLEDQVRARTLPFDAYLAQLGALGYRADDVELLASLLADELGA